MEKLVLIDGNSLLNRAFYATPPFTAKDGFPTNGIYGFIKLLFKIISDKSPQYLAVAFDLHAPTFRHKMYGEYKAGRRPMPEELVAQLPVLKEILGLMRIKIVEKEGYEADDVIGTMSRKYPVHTYIYTGDRDAYQLVNDAVSVCFTRKGVSDILELTSENFTQETGLTPAQIIDLKALMGDKSDHIPGVSGVGEQTAKNLLLKYGTLSGVYEHVNEQSAALKNKLEAGAEQAQLSYTLAKIDVDAPVDCTLSECVLKTPFPYVVRQKFAALDFRSLIASGAFLATEADDAGKDGRDEAENKGALSCEETVCRTAAEAEELFDSAAGEYVSCVLNAENFRFSFRRGETLTEAVVNVKNTLVDEGVFAEELTPLLRRVFGGKNTLICYDAKAAMHRLAEYGVEFKAPFEDVSLLRYVAEGSPSPETLSYLLDARGYASDRPAAGLYVLFGDYQNSLTAEEANLYKNVELPLVKVLFDMEQTGVCVNESMIDELSARFEAEIGEVSEKIYTLAGERFNLNSPAQLGKILFDKLHIDRSDTKKTKAKKNYGTSAEVLEKYADEYEIVRCVLRFRQLQKLNSTYLEGIRPLIVNGRVHTTYNQINTSTGRLSSANPNLQNIPVRTDEGRELRKLFTAGENNVLVDADYSQIELRLMAHFSGCKALKEAYAKGEDIHALTASQVFGVPIEQVTPKMRREAKAVNFGIIYGISAFGLAKDLGIGAKAAKSYIDKYFETYAEVKKYIDENVEKAKDQGFVSTLYGRRREIIELKSSNYAVRSFGERAAMNMPLQGTAADIVKIAMLRVYDRLKKEGLQARLVLQVHDELVVDCPESEREKVKEILKYEMEHAADLSVPLEAETGAGKSWYDAH